MESVGELLGMMDFEVFLLVFKTACRAFVLALVVLRVRVLPIVKFSQINRWRYNFR